MESVGPTVEELRARPTPVSVQEFMRLPESNCKVELIDGEVHPEGSRELCHQDTVASVAFALHGFCRASGAGRVYLGPFDVFSDDRHVLQPDLLFVSTERLGLVKANGVHGAPDLVVEVVSPGTREVDLGRKRIAYARAGVREMWVLEPRIRNGRVYRAPDVLGREVVAFGPAAELESPLLPGFLFRAADIFAG